MITICTVKSTDKETKAGVVLIKFLYYVATFVPAIQKCSYR